MNRVGPQRSAIGTMHGTDIWRACAVVPASSGFTSVAAPFSSRLISARSRRSISSAAVRSFKLGRERALSQLLGLVLFDKRLHRAAAHERLDKTAKTGLAGRQLALELRSAVK